jgi:hypothetical protein
MTLALLVLASTSAFAEETRQIWSARPSMRLGTELVPAQALLSPLPQEDAAAAGITFDRDGRISLDAGISIAHAHGDALATLPWCAEASGLLRVGAFGRDCLMQGTVQLELPGRVATAGTGTQWHGDRFDLSLAYGFSWLLPNAGDRVNAPYLAPQDLGLASLVAQPLLPGQSGDAQSLGINSQWRLTAESALQLNAALRQLRLRNGNVAPVLDLQQAMLDVGMSYGAFSGNVTGRVNRLSEQSGYPNSYWSGIDIGVSWRTPWRGELTVGARNVVGKASADEPAAAERSLGESTVRTPYVRYKQDL